MPYPDVLTGVGELIGKEITLLVAALVTSNGLGVLFVDWATITRVMKFS
jgi:hypothetical protein